MNNLKRANILQGGIYLHIPYCKRRCIYCDFYNEISRRQDWSRLVDGLLAEASQRLSILNGVAKLTIYCGGGTPSLMPISEMQRLMEGIRLIVAERFGESLSIIESTIEVNPDDVTEELALGWKKAGFDRISMGVQTLNDMELKVIGRRHNAEQAERAYSILRRYFSNISLDLMFGLPYQTLDSLELTINRFLAMRPEHISAYSLMYEERSALTRMRDQGKIEETDEELSNKMFDMINNRLAEAGYNRYEISNYSLPERESRHNSAYWRGYPYIGLGPSAHSYDGERCRSFNVSNISEYLIGIESLNPDRKVEILSDKELQEEFILTRMRTKDGISIDEYSQKFGEEATAKLLMRAKRDEMLGNLVITNGSIRISDAGVMISDEIIINLF